MIKRTNAGDRRIRIEIQSPTQDTNDWGQPVQSTWTTFARPWAARLNHSGRRFFQAQQTHTEVTEAFNVRYLPGIVPGMRVVAGGVTYEILDVDDREGRHVEIDLLCRGLVNA